MSEIHLLPLRGSHAQCGATTGESTAEINVVTCAECIRQHDELTADTFDQLDEFTQAYITTALWSSNDESDPETGGDPMDMNYGPEDIEPETLAKMAADCAAFQAAHGDWFTDQHCLKYGPDFGIEGRAGHDFWLTRNGHGAGFWDGDWSDEAGEVLTEAAKAFDEFNLYVGDDGLIYGS